MSGLILSTCDRALSPAGGVPEWVHILPAGHIMSRDGREFDLPDPAVLVLDFQDRGVDLVIDYEHQNDIPAAKLKGPIPAAGWIKELAADETGLWGRVEWTTTARDMIARKEYRYLSPSFLHKAGHIMRLNGAGLVHRPALHLKALASQEVMMPPQNTPTLKTQDANDIIRRIAELLGLETDATADQVLAALVPRLATAQEQAPDPSKFVPVEAVAELLTDRNLRISTMQEAQTKAMVDKAFDEGYLTPGMRGWATELCQQDPDSFKAFMSMSPRPFAHLLKPLARPFSAVTDQDDESDEAAAICSQLGLKPGSLNT